MTDDAKRADASRRLFASGLTFREGAELMLSWGEEHAGSAAALCCQSAARMITALIWLEDLPVAAYEDTLTGRWIACTEAHGELKRMNMETLFLLACEWAGYPKEPWEQEPNMAFARDAIECTDSLEKALVQIAPELAPGQEPDMGMEQAPRL